jgi:hypothetical protein
LGDSLLEFPRRLQATRVLFQAGGDGTGVEGVGVDAVAGPDVDDPRLVELVGELSLRSERFRTLWARQDVRYKTSGTSLLLHPQVGPLELHYEKLLIPGTDMQTLVTYHAQPGTDSDERLKLLASAMDAAPADTVPQPAQVNDPALDG